MHITLYITMMVYQCSNALHGKPVVFIHFLLIVCNHVLAVSTHASSVLARLNLLKQLVIRHASM